MNDIKTDKINGIRQRIKKFVLQVILYAKQIPKDEVGRVFVHQLLRAVTSIGANFEEASEAQSNRDLIYKLYVVKKEAKESHYWIDLTCEAFPDLSFQGATLKKENIEIIRIISSIINKKKIEH